jgi:hypothetical protein
MRGDGVWQAVVGQIGTTLRRHLVRVGGSATSFVANALRCALIHQVCFVVDALSRGFNRLLAAYTY